MDTDEGVHLIQRVLHCRSDHDPTLVPDTQNEHSASEEMDTPYLVTVECLTDCGFVYAQVSMNVDVSNSDLEEKGSLQRSIIDRRFWSSPEVIWMSSMGCIRAGSK